jgi:hypothetical protein
MISAGSNSVWTISCWPAPTAAVTAPAPAMCPNGMAWISVSPGCELNQPGSSCSTIGRRTVALRCVNITPLGAPVVPEVYNCRNTSPRSTTVPTGPVDWRATHSSNRSSITIRCPPNAWLSNSGSTNRTPASDSSRIVVTSAAARRQIAGTSTIPARAVPISSWQTRAEFLPR